MNDIYGICIFSQMRYIQYNCNKNQEHIWEVANVFASVLKSALVGADERINMASHSDRESSQGHSMDRSPERTRQRTAKAIGVILTSHVLDVLRKYSCIYILHDSSRPKWIEKTHLFETVRLIQAVIKCLGNQSIKPSGQSVNLNTWPFTWFCYDAWEMLTH